MELNRLRRELYFGGRYKDKGMSLIKCFSDSKNMPKPLHGQNVLYYNTFDNIITKMRQCLQARKKSNIEQMSLVSRCQTSIVLMTNRSTSYSGKVDDIHDLETSRAKCDNGLERKFLSDFLQKACFLRLKEDFAKSAP